MTTTRYPGNPDFHEIPPRCADCGRFTGSLESEDASVLGVWERNDNWDLPDTWTNRCLECATDRVQERFDIDDRDEATAEVLAAISGGGQA